MLRMLRRPSHGTIVAYLALFVAVGGTAYAAATITGADVVDESLTGADIQNKSVAGADIACCSVGSAKVVDNSLGAIDLAPDSVGTSEVADNSLTGVDIDDSTLDVGKVGGVGESTIFGQLPKSPTGSTTFINDSGLQVSLKCSDIGYVQAGIAVVGVGTGTLGSVHATVGSDIDEAVLDRVIRIGEGSGADFYTQAVDQKIDAVIHFRTPTGTTISVDLIVIPAENELGTTSDCFAFGHMRKS